MKTFVAALGVITLLTVSVAPAVAQQPTAPPSGTPPAGAGGHGHGAPPAAGAGQRPGGMMGGQRPGGTMGGQGMGSGMMMGGMMNMCPMMAMPMMGMMGGGDMLGMMGMGPGADPKTTAQMLQLRGELMKAIGDVLVKHGKALEGAR